MTATDLQEQCELGQRQLMAMDYLAAERTLAAAAAVAWSTRDFDSLSRLYMPLQEARRQKRQRAGEGVVCLDLVAQSAQEQPDAERIAREIPHGQILIAGWGSIQPGVRLRKLQAERSQYAETLLGAAYRVQGELLVVVTPLPDSALPLARPMTRDEFAAALPRRSFVLRAGELPPGRVSETAQTYGLVSSFWERLHAPFLEAAEGEIDPISRIQKYARAIEVDYACEFAHQRLAAVAKGLANIKPA